MAFMVAVMIVAGEQLLGVRKVTSGAIHSSISAFCQLEVSPLSLPSSVVVVLAFIQQLSKRVAKLSIFPLVKFSR